MILACVVTLPGLEEWCIRELSEIIGVSGRARGNVIEFSALISQIIRFSAHSQTATRVLIWPSFFQVKKELSTTLESCKNTNPFSQMAEVIRKGESFKVECERFGDHSFTSGDVAAGIGAFATKLAVVDVRKPVSTIFCQIDGSEGVLGFDIAGFDLAKRYYKVFSTPRSARGPLGYVLARSAAEDHDSFLDPACGSGVIPIELAIWSLGISVHTYQKERFTFANHPSFKDDIQAAFEPREIQDMEIYAYDGFMPNVVAAKKNAKIAGVHKQIRFGRSETEWLDVKFKQGEIDCAALHAPPSPHLKQIFYQLDFVLAPKSTISLTLAQGDVRKIAAEYGFVIVKEAPVGRFPLSRLLLRREGKP